MGIVAGIDDAVLDDIGAVRRRREGPGRPGAIPGGADAGDIRRLGQGNLVALGRQDAHLGVVVEFRAAAALARIKGGIAIEELAGLQRVGLLELGVAVRPVGLEFQEVAAPDGRVGGGAARMRGHPPGLGAAGNGAAKAFDVAGLEALVEGEGGSGVQQQRKRQDESS